MMMMQQNKKGRKWPMQQKSYNLTTFPEAKLVFGPFCNTLAHLLYDFAEIQEDVNDMWVWRIRLIHNHNQNQVSMYIIQEFTKQPCSYCHASGWGHHLIAKRMYHLIIPKEEWDTPLTSEIFNLQNSLLYGLIHWNGFGHLLSINGREGGSKFLYGEEIMDFWDRICTHLQTREITVQDLSVKRGMPVRLLHGIAYGRPWFGKWDYKFCRGSFGVNKYDYKAAIEMLRSIDLKDFSSWDGVVQKIIYHYKSLDSSLNNLGDLFKFMLTHRSSNILVRSATETLSENGYESFTTNITKSFSIWPKKKLERVAELVVNALRKKKTENGAGKSVMTREEALDSAFFYAKNTDLIDHVLKLLNNVVVDDCILCCAVNPQTYVGESKYEMKEVNRNAIARVDLLTLVPLKSDSLMPGNDINFDIDCLYCVLRDCKDSKLVDFAVKTVVDTKIFNKEWPFMQQSDGLGLLRFNCNVRPALEGLEKKFTRGYPPGEHIVIPRSSSVREFKSFVQFTMRKLYHIMDRIKITELEGEREDDEEDYFGTVEPGGSEYWFRAIDIDFENDLMYEGGKDITGVKCKCGANDFDGEKMTVCEVCKVWQHTRCSGINISNKYSVCRSCLSPQRNFMVKDECCWP